MLLHAYARKSVLTGRRRALILDVLRMDASILLPVMRRFSGDS
jgi:hypothetical protein